MKQKTIRQIQKLVKSDLKGIIKNKKYDKTTKEYAKELLDRYSISSDGNYIAVENNKKNEFDTLKCIIYTDKMKLATISLCKEVIPSLEKNKETRRLYAEVLSRDMLREYTEFKEKKGKYKK